jgi:hypothetical protein
LKTGPGHWLAVALVVFTVGCDSPEEPDPVPVPGSPAWRESQTFSVEEAVHRFQFGDYRSGLQWASWTYCLARDTATELLPWTDPPDALLRRFAGHQPPVKKVSLCRLDLQSLNAVTDVETGGPAVIFRLGPPRWESDTEVIVEGGHHVNGLNGSGKTYRVRLQGGTWVVVQATLRWIS